MATRFHERLAQVRLQPRPAAARDWRAAFADAALRQRLHRVVLLLVPVVGVGVLGLYLWRR